MYKYGMRYDSIRYWQGQAKDLRRMRGLVPHDSMVARYKANYATMSSRDIGHIAIMLAVNSGNSSLLEWELGRPSEYTK